MWKVWMTGWGAGCKQKICSFLEIYGLCWIINSASPLHWSLGSKIKNIGRVWTLLKVRPSWKNQQSASYWTVNVSNPTVSLWQKKPHGLPYPSLINKESMGLVCEGVCTGPCRVCVCWAETLYGQAPLLGGRGQTWALASCSQLSTWWMLTRVEVWTKL